MRLQERAAERSGFPDIGGDRAAGPRRGGGRQSVAGGVGSECGKRDASPFRLVASSALRLPTLTGMPRHLDLTTNPSALLDLCEQLLDGGVLEAGDWSGDVATSLKAGLDRWVNGVCGASSLHFLNALIFSVTENLVLWNREYIPLEEDPFLLALKKGVPWVDVSKPLGAMMIHVDSSVYGSTYGRQVIVGERVMQMEKICPGCGFMLLAVVNEALYSTVGAGTLPWCYDEWMGGFYEEDDEELPSFGRWEGIVPREAYLYTLSEVPLHAALGRARLPVPMRGMLKQAIAMAKAMKSLSSNFNHAEFQASSDSAHMFADLPLLIRWNGECGSDFVFDHYHEMLHETEPDYKTGIAFMRVWQEGLLDAHPVSLCSAVGAMRQAFGLMAAADRLLQFLDSTDLFVKGVKERVRQLERGRIRV